MEKMISRTVTSFEYPVSKIVTDENGTPSFIPLDPIVSVVKLNTKRLSKLASDTYPGAQLFFGDARAWERTYVMPLTDFIANAELKEDN